MIRATQILCLLLLTACAHLPRVKLPSGAQAQAPRDNGTPATAVDNTTTSTIVVPAGSTVTAPSSAKVAGIAGVVEAPPIVATLSRDSELRVVSRAASASTGTIDTTVATRRADNEARQPLLFAAIAAGVMAGVFQIWLKYPTGAFLCAVAGGVFLFAWQLASLPSWFWVIGLAAGAVAVGIYFGFERGEKSASAGNPPAA